MNPSDPQWPAAAALDGLRGYHLPDGVSWWPPASGWWLLFGVMLVVIVGLAWLGLQRWRRQAAARQAMRELAQLRRQLEAGEDQAELIRRLSRLLRRFALASYPNQPVAGLTGEPWLTFLDRYGGDGRFLRGPGRLLAEAPYRPVVPTAVGELVALVSDWIQRNREPAV